MYLRIPFRWLAKPSHLSMIAVMMSFLAWICPDFGVLRKGFDIPEHLDFISAALLTIWYGLIFSAFSLGQLTGTFTGSLLKHKTTYPPLDSDEVYWSFSLLAALGTVVMLLNVIRTLSLPMVILSIAGGQANLLGEALHENYSFGVVSLRYLVVYSASLSLCRMIRSRTVSILNVANLIFLLLNATARLMLIATFLITLFMLKSDNRTIKINVVKVAGMGITLFFVLSLVNYSRNYGYYQSTGHSFWGAGISEIIAYLGSPFQAAVGSTKALDYIVQGNSYRNYVDIEEALNTNTALVGLHEQIGYLAWTYIGTICLFMGFMFSFMRSFQRTAFLLPCGAILYGSAELWRVDLYQQGIFITWFICGIGVPLALLVYRQVRTSLRKSYPLTTARREYRSTFQLASEHLQSDPGDGS